MSEPFCWEPGWDDPDDPGRPVPLGELSFEQECALITPEALLALQADILCDPGAVPIASPARRRKKQPATRKKQPPPDKTAPVADAALRVRNLLKVCCDEKWRRLKESPCYEAIKKTALPQIAKMALDLRRGSDMPLSEAVGAAVMQIECDDYVQVEMALDGSYLDGIKKFRLSRQAHANHLKQLAGMPKWEWRRNEHGKPLPVEFEAGLKALFPLPGCRGVRGMDERVRRFTEFLIGIVRDEHPNVIAAEEQRERLEEERLKLLKERWIKAGQALREGERIKPLSEQEKWSLVTEAERGQIRAEVKRRLRKMKRDGIPAHLFRVAILWVDELHKERVSAERSEASRARWLRRPNKFRLFRKKRLDSP